jgi:5'-nucleotidase
VPDLPLEQIKGIKLTRLGHRARAAAPVRTVNPRGKECYWLAAAGEVEDGAEGTDFHAVAQGYVSITPLQLDRTFHPQMDDVKQWLEGVL